MVTESAYCVIWISKTGFRQLALALELNEFGVDNIFYVFERSPTKALFIRVNYSKNNNTVKHYYKNTCKGESDGSSSFTIAGVCLVGTS